MSHSVEEHIGARIAHFRKLRQLTQIGLAQRAYVSRGTIAKIEAGLTPATPAVVAAVARVLQVDIAALNGQPYISELRKDHLDHLISPLSEALDMYDLGPDPAITPRSIERISGDVEQLCAATCATEYKKVGERLPGILAELTTAISSLPSDASGKAAAYSLSWCYWISYEFAYRLGFHDLASIALERMGWMAERAQDPLLLATRLNKRSSMLLRRGNNRMSLKVLERAQELVQQHGKTNSLPGFAVKGSLHLSAAITAAQARDDEAVTGHIELARETAGKIGRDVPSVYWASFGMTNVAHFEVATLVELGKLGEAAKAARGLHFPPTHPRIRIGRYHIEMARAYAQMGKNEASEGALHRARDVAPQQAKYHPLVRDTIGVLVRRQRHVPDGLSSLASWVRM